MLWHGAEPIGICVFTSSPLALAQRNRFFRLSGRWSRLAFQALNRRVVMLSRVVIHPTYRGAGIAAAFVRKSCEACEWPWVEALAQMGHFHPFFERAGFTRIGTGPGRPSSRRGHSALYGTRRGRRGRKRLVSKETFEKSRFAEPVYYIFDNRANARRDSSAAEPGGGDEFDAR